jgi:alpha-L-rhamnosidase
VRSARRACFVGATLMILAVGTVPAGASAPPGIAGPTSAAPGPPHALRVDGLIAPIGLAVTDIQFAWQVNDPRRGATQTAYRIIVTRPVLTGAPGATTPVWDSGRIVAADQSAVPYVGPALAPDTAYQWTVQTWSQSDGPGALATPASFETGLTDQDWQAQWIQRPAHDPDQYTYARKEFNLGGSPIVRARVSVSADQQYELSINGVRVGKGQAYSYPDSQYYETLDATRALRAGRANAFGLLYSWQGATKAHPAGSPGVIAQLSVLHQDGTSELIVTDGSWHVLKANWLPGTQRDQEGDQVDFTENIDGAHAPTGWDQPGFDDRTWASATVLGPAGVAPWTHLIAVRTRIVEQPVRAVSLTRLANGSVVADFGKVYAAAPMVTFVHGRSGRRVAMHAGYLLDPHPSSGPPGQVSTVHGTQHTDLSYSYVQRGGRQTFHPFDYLGFRYLQIDRPGETLTPSDVMALTRHSVMPDQATATFSSPDPTVNAVFQLGVHSALFSAQEQYVDTPTREKGPWLWDGFNESQTAMSAFGEQNLTRKSLLEFAQSQTRYWPQGRMNKIYPTGLGAEDINEFSEIYPEWVWQYWLATGDRTLLEAVYPTVANLSDYVQNAVAPSTGLVTSLPATNVYYAFPVVTRLNVLGTDVFRRAGDIAAALGRPPGEVSRQRDRQAALTAAINTRLTRSDGVYVDGVLANGKQTKQASQESNTAAVAYQVVPANREAHVAAYIAARGMTNPPRTAAEVLAALRLTRRDRDFVHRVIDRTAPGWANILAHGATFTWEVWKPSDIIGDSMSHGWGSNVVVEIRRELLGVEPTGPGYATFDVTPPRGGLASASGVVPTPRGSITVAWHRSSPGSSTLKLTVPANATATVRLATSSPTRITESHHPLRRAVGVQLVGRDHGDAVLRVGAGTYDFQAR